jgi:hypothetical protein
MNADDQDLLARLGAVAAAVDGPPDLAYELGRAALAWRDPDAEMAQLVADSETLSAGVRGGPQDNRMLSFEADDLTIEVQVSVSRGQRSLIGQVLPEPSEGGGVVHAQTPTGSAPPAHLDTVGRFQVDAVPGDLLRLRIERPGGEPVTTVWVNL